MKSNTSNSISRRHFLKGSGSAALLTTGSFYLAQSLRAEDSPNTSIVETSAGTLRGKVINGINSFKGIPYASPPINERRFLAPQAHSGWTGVRDAFQYGHYAVQSKRQRGTKQLQFFHTLGFRSVETPGASEDCLVLNVWSQGLNDGGKRPVMVWLHGGGYDQGTGGSVGYDGLALAKNQNVVTVTINHRLNAFGYLYLGDILGDEYTAAANAGQQDIVAALQWVKQNIEQFGGDPNRVMIFGQSGGAGKVATLLGMPSAKGLFHAAAMQSGGGRGMPSEQATEISKKLLSDLGIPLARAKEILTTPAEKIIDTYGRGGPVIDGTVLPDNPIGSPLSKDVPLIIGNTRTERTVYTVDDPSYGQLSETQLLENVTKLVGGKAKDVIAQYRDARPKLKPFMLDYLISNDIADNRNFDVAEARNQHNAAKTYVYRWDWETPVMELLAPHCMEIPFVFQHIEDCQSMTGPISDKMRYLQVQASTAWANLAKNGSPNHQDLPNWEAYSANKKPVMLFNTPSRLEHDPGAKLRGMRA